MVGPECEPGKWAPGSMISDAMQGCPGDNAPRCLARPGGVVTGEDLKMLFYIPHSSYNYHIFIS